MTRGGPGVITQIWAVYQTIFGDNFERISVAGPGVIIQIRTDLSGRFGDNSEKD